MSDLVKLISAGIKGMAEHALSEAGAFLTEAQAKKIKSLELEAFEIKERLRQGDTLYMGRPIQSELFKTLSELNKLRELTAMTQPEIKAQNLIAQFMKIHHDLDKSKQCSIVLCDEMLADLRVNRVFWNKVKTIIQNQ